MLDEGFTDDDEFETVIQHFSVRQRQDLAYRLLASLPRSQLAKIQRDITPWLQIDIIGMLPTEVALQIFSYLSATSLLTCTLVSRRWRILGNDQWLWMRLCAVRGWKWKQPRQVRDLPWTGDQDWHPDDEGVGEDEPPDGDTGFASSIHLPTTTNASAYPRKPKPPSRHSAPAIFRNTHSYYQKPDYKLLHQTHLLLQNRLRHASYRLATLQTRRTPDSHTSTVYCLQLHTVVSTAEPQGRQYLFSGSRDESVRQWDLVSGRTERIFFGAHIGSILSLCAAGNWLVTGGSDCRVAVWDLESGKLLGVIQDHSDGVLCVRFDGRRLASCSKDRTVRTYAFPSLDPRLVLTGHRAAVNAIAMSSAHIVSASGDRSVRLWDINTGQLLHTFEGHHARGIAAIDFSPPQILSGSSDKHLRLIDLTTTMGWSTATADPSPHHHPPANGMCETCGAVTSAGRSADDDEDSVIVPSRRALVAAAGGAGNVSHKDLVRAVEICDQWVLSGSYDQTIKVWDRKSGELIADLTGGHTGRIFSLSHDYTKIVSCGEDQRICIWDFSYGIDTSFIEI